ncbi:MAG: LysM peptidoglycan-binding domain-containing protein [Verrucomicrobia bacterium]|nr:LysM peptidoglycan-binding domain-containing protein [Verrucomicrobiota bacterium]
MKTVRRPVRRTPRKRLRAAAHRAPARYTEEEYVSEEPNVKLSRAFVVVLLLHVVAVGGIFAFSALKDRQLAATSTAIAASTPNRPSPDNSPRLTATKTSATTNDLQTAKYDEPSGNPSTHKVKAGETVASIAAEVGCTVRDLEVANNLKPGSTLTVGRELTIPDRTQKANVPSEVQRLLQPNGKSAASPTPEKGASETGKYYIVQRGDSPASIAKKLKTNSYDLLKANNIDDPKKLQIGQRLVIPGKGE